MANKWQVFLGNDYNANDWQAGDNAARVACRALADQIAARFGLSAPNRYGDPNPDAPGDSYESATFSWPNVNPGRGYALLISDQAQSEAGDLLGELVNDPLPDDNGRPWGLPPGGGL